MSHPTSQYWNSFNLRAQASESSSTDVGRKLTKNDTFTRKPTAPDKPVASYTTNVDSDSSSCVACKEKHPLYLCSKFRAMPHDEKRSLLKSNALCLNCLRPGHFVKNCKSLHKINVTSVKDPTTLRFMWRMATNQRQTHHLMSPIPILQSRLMQSQGFEPTHCS